LKICVDTTVLLDILKDEYREYQEKFYLAWVRNEKLLIPSVVFAELMPQFKGNRAVLESFLSDHKIITMPLDVDSVSEASRRWMKYLRRKPRKTCPNCGKVLDFKERVLSDFYIGGFAIKRCDVLLTRDRGIYKKYFPELKGYENCL
jgi:predicted nucleic acid-binding protein